LVKNSDFLEFTGLKEARIVTDITACANDSGISFVQVYYGLPSANANEEVANKVEGSIHGLADARTDEGQKCKNLSFADKGGLKYLILDYS